MALAAYWLLLGTWIIFLPPLWRGPRRGWQAAAVLLGLLALARELWFILVVGPVAVGPIRIDIPMIAFLLAALYLAAALRARAAGWARTAVVGSIVALAGGGGMAASWAAGLVEAGQLMALLANGDRMLFEARFRNQAAFQRAFDITAEASDFPVGHWQAQASPVHSRLIVNPAGQAFLYYRCLATECQYGPGARLVRAGDGRWQTTLRFPGVGERHLAVTRVEPDALTAEIDDRLVHFRRTPPPLLRLEEPEALSFLGTFSAAEPIGQHSRVSQLWLWSDGDDRLAVGIFQFLLPGRRADFVTPVVLGRGRSEGGGWRFRWHDRKRDRSARIVVSEAEFVEITFQGESAQWPEHSLRRDGIFRDAVIELAPLTNAEDWAHWFDVQLPGHFTSAQIPGT